MPTVKFRTNPTGRLPIFYAQLIKLFVVDYYTPEIIRRLVWNNETVIFIDCLEKGKKGEVIYKTNVSIAIL